MGENMETEESGINLIDLLLKVVEEQNNSIEDNARALSRDFWTEKLDNNDKGKFEDRGHLGCRIRVKGEGGAVYAEWYKTIWIKATGRGSRQMCRVDKFGFPRTGAKKIPAESCFSTGDIVVARVLRGKYAGQHIGRIAVRGRPSYRLTTREKIFDVHPKYLTAVHRADGYSY